MMFALTLKEGIPFVSSYQWRIQRAFSETKLFHVRGIFKNNEIKSAKRTPTPFLIFTSKLNTWSDYDRVLSSRLKSTKLGASATVVVVAGCWNLSEFV